MRALSARPVTEAVWDVDAIRGAGCDQDKPVKAVGVSEAQLHANDTSHAVADVGEAIQGEGVGHAYDVGGHLLDAVALVGVGAVAGAATIHDDAAVAVFDLVDHGWPRVVGAGVAVVEEDGVTVAGLVVEEVDAVDVVSWH